MFACTHDTVWPTSKHVQGLKIRLRVPEPVAGSVVTAAPVLQTCVQLKHSALLEKNSQLQGLQQQLAELRQQLSKYHELPATLLGARMKLDEAKKQFEEKQERFRSHLADT